MNEALLAKCSCSHCGNHIEFPFDAADLVVGCPHCSQQTQLTLETPAVTSFHTHPSDGDCIRRARKAGESGIFQLDLPASALFFPL